MVTEGSGQPNQGDVGGGSSTTLTLPNIREFRKNFAQLDIPDEDKDNIYLWWKQISQTSEHMERFSDVINFPSLPENEKEHAHKVYQQTETTFEGINNSISDFLKMPKGNIRNQIIRPFVSFLSIETPDEKAINKITSLLDEYQEDDPLFYEQVIAVCEAIEATKDLKLKEKIIRQKIAQWGFEEMMALLPYWRLIYLNDLNVEDPTTVDPLELEKNELIKALQSPLWDGKEKRKWRAIYRNFRKMMRSYEFEPDVKKAFKYVFEIAVGDGDLAKTSAIRILQEVEYAWHGIKDDSTLQEVWEMQEEEAEYDEEDEEYEE